jgi:hypothetical protein
MSSSLQRAVHALRALLPSAHPSPCPRLPGYLRALTAEAAAQEHAPAPHARPPPFRAPAPEDDDAARRAYTQLVQTIFSRVVDDAQAAPHPPAFEGLAQLEGQQRAGAGAAPPAAHVTRALAAVSYHHRLMDGTPRGRKLQENWQRQVILETRAVDAAAARYRREVSVAVARGAGATLPAARELLVSWFQPLAEAIRQEQAHVARGTPGVDRSVYGPYLLRLDPEQLAVIAMHAAVNAFMSPEADADAVGSAPGTTRMTRLAVAIGRAVEQQHNVNQLEEACHAHNMRRREVRELHAAGRALRAALEQRGDLAPGEWEEWFQLGAGLRAAGEMLPLDHKEWFQVGHPSDLDDLNRRRRHAARRSASASSCRVHLDI